MIVPQWALGHVHSVSYSRPMGAGRRRRWACSVLDSPPNMGKLEASKWQLTTQWMTMPRGGWACQGFCCSSPLWLMRVTLQDCSGFGVYRFSVWKTQQRSECLLGQRKQVSRATIFELVPWQYRNKYLICLVSVHHHFFEDCRGIWCVGANNAAVPTEHTTTINPSESNETSTKYFHHQNTFIIFQQGAVYFPQKNVRSLVLKAPNVDMVIRAQVKCG